MASFLTGLYIEYSSLGNASDKKINKILFFLVLPLTTKPFQKWGLLLKKEKKNFL